MAVVTRVRRVVGNPRRRAHKARARRRRRRTSNARRVHRSRSKPKRRYARPRSQSRGRGHRPRSSNPALVVTLTGANPRRKKVRRSHRRKKSNARHRRSYARRRRTRNAPRVVVVRRRGGRRRRARNPNLFGASVSTAQMGQAVLGGLIGVAATKMLPPALPAQFISTPAMRVLASAGAAFASGWLAGRFNDRFGSAVLFGGLMQTGSVLLNAFLPSLGRQIGLAGMGELMEGRFVVPQNPLRQLPMAAPAQARVAVSGLQRAYGTAF